jgi:hypothetical protein
LRDHCKRSIEALEHWLRRLIDREFTEKYGAGYLDADRPGSGRLIRGEMARRLKDLAAQHPGRYPRPIDAATLEDIIDLICNPELYRIHFADALSTAFPESHMEARTFLSRLVPPRNALHHANPISVHDAYRVLCYTQDVIAALKEYYRKQNMNQQFNAPTFIRVSDSVGHVFHLSDRDGPAMLDYSQDNRAYLRFGDTISIEVDVDPTFDPSNYDIRWLIANIGGPTTYGRKFASIA